VDGFLVLLRCRGLRQLKIGLFFGGERRKAVYLDGFGVHDGKT
jgi:hypothetical protein